MRNIITQIFTSTKLDFSSAAKTWIWPSARIHALAVRGLMLVAGLYGPMQPLATLVCTWRLCL